METVLVTELTARLAKQKGFNEWCHEYYQDGSIGIKYQRFGVKASDTHDYIYPAPSQSILQKWLRERYDIQILIDFSCAVSLKQFVFNYEVWTLISDDFNCVFDHDNFETYEIALEDAFQKILKSDLIKNI